MSDAIGPTELDALVAAIINPGNHCIGAAPETASGRPSARRPIAAPLHGRETRPPSRARFRGSGKRRAAATHDPPAVPKARSFPKAL